MSAQPPPALTLGSARGLFGLPLDVCRLIYDKVAISIIPDDHSDLHCCPSIITSSNYNWQQRNAAISTIFQVNRQMRAETEDFRSLYLVFEYTIVVNSVRVARDVLNTPIIRQNLRCLTFQLGPDVFDLPMAMEVAKSCILLGLVSVLCDGNDFPHGTGLFRPFFNVNNAVAIITRSLERLSSLPQFFDIQVSILEHRACILGADDEGFGLSDKEKSGYCKACRQPHNLEELNKAMEDQWAKSEETPYDIQFKATAQAYDLPTDQMSNRQFISLSFQLSIIPSTTKIR
jgi:hypothetical protein